jgi:Arc/MetJ-type ribon-helix-helix transcriptional regulator
MMELTIKRDIYTGRLPAVRCEAELSDMVKRIAQDANVNVSDVIREAVRFYLRENVTVSNVLESKDGDK